MREAEKLQMSGGIVYSSQYTSQKKKKCVKNSFQAEEHNILLYSTYKGLLLKI